MKKSKLYREAFSEAISRYPHAIDALVWFTAATGILAEDPTKEQLDWAEDQKLKNRPDNCRNALRDAGKSYPRSGCDVCHNGGLMGCPYERRNNEN